MPCVVNAANEVAVASFLQGEIYFPAIADIIGRAMEAHTLIAQPTLADLERVDAQTRELARIFVADYRIAASH